MGMITMITLGAVVLAALTLPFFFHKIEENLEFFLLGCGLLAVSLSGAWSGHLVWEALREPVFITSAVLILGLLFKRFGHKTAPVIHRIEQKIGPKWFLFCFVFFLGLFSSLLTAIIAALLTSEVIKLLDLDEKNKIKLTVYTCFAIGFGAVLTPIGEPLSTIVVAKLKGPPYYADFLFLFKLLGMWIIPGLLVFGILGARLAHKPLTSSQTDFHAGETYLTILQRTGKVYLFVAGLILLGEGLKPLAQQTITHLSKYALYWINILSAVLDNATVASILITPELSREVILFLLISLVTAGGLLIPGNIPNIICAAKLNIKSRAWAKTAFPVGLSLLVVYFLILCIV